MLYDVRHPRILDLKDSWTLEDVPQALEDSKAQWQSEYLGEVPRLPEGMTEQDYEDWVKVQRKHQKGER